MSLAGVQIGVHHVFRNIMTQVLALGYREMHAHRQ
jgi:hypothetical protein